MRDFQNTPFTFHHKEKNWYAYYDGQGGADYRNEKTEFRDSGKIRMLPDGRLCTKWKKIRKGKEQCYSMWKGKGSLLFIRNNQLYNQVTVKLGKR